MPQNAIQALSLAFTMAINFFQKKYCFSLTIFCFVVFRGLGYRSTGPGFDSQCYQVSKEVAVLKRVPLSLVRIIEDLLERKK
jgi:hypothetical protein